MNIEEKLKILKSLRKEKDISQEELAHGICSVPYLSKMENLKVVPSEEVLDLLMEKLNVNSKYLNNNEVIEDVWKFYHSMQDKNLDEAEKRYNQLQEIIGNHLVDPQVSIYFKLFSIRYYLLLRDFSQAKMFIDLSKQLSDMFDLNMNYYFEKFSGQYHYLTNEFELSLDSFRRAEKILEEILLEDREKYDLYYNIALSLSRMLKVSESIFYVKESLNFYNKIYNFHSSINCNILLSINFRRIGNHQGANEYLQNALKIAQSIGDNALLGKIFHNMGFLFTLEGKSKEAITHYKKSLNNKNENDLSKCQTYHAIAKEYLNLNNKKQGIKWCQLGLTFAKENNKQSHIYHLTILAHLLGERIEDLECYLSDEVIPYFQEINAFEEVVRYTEMLAQYYEENFHYKKANKLYKQLITNFKSLNTLS